MIRRIRILHISDLHIKKDQGIKIDESAENAISKMADFFRGKDLGMIDSFVEGDELKQCFDDYGVESKAELKNAVLPFDILVISGDIVNQDSVEKETQIYDVLEKIESEVQDKRWMRIITRDQIIVCNGNHDLIREDDGRQKVRAFATATNKFYKDITIPVDPNIDDEACTRLFYFHDSKIGFPPSGANMKLVAFNSELLLAHPENKHIPTLGPVRKKYLDKCLKSFSDSPENFLIVVGHSCINRVNYATVCNSAKFQDDELCASTALLQFLNGNKVNMFLCGHLDSPTSLPNDINNVMQFTCGPLKPQVHKHQKNCTFFCYELENAYPGDTRLLSAYLCCTGELDTDSSSGWEKSNILEEPWMSYNRKYGVESKIRFHKTLNHKKKDHENKFKSYKLLFYDNNHGHTVCYPDIYTRYFQWIFETMDSSSPDTFYVTHCGKFDIYLYEQMNSDYFFHVVKKNKEKEIMLRRLWFNPPRFIKNSGEELPKGIIEKMLAIGITPYECLGKNSFAENAYGLALGGSSYDHRTETVKQDEMHKTIILEKSFWLKKETDILKRFEENESKIYSINIAKERSKEIFDGVTEIIDRINLGQTNLFTKAFCLRRDEVLLFQYDPKNGPESTCTQAEIFLSKIEKIGSDPLVGQNGEWRIKEDNWMLFRLVRYLEQLFQDLPNYLYPIRVGDLGYVEDV